MQAAGVEMRLRSSRVKRALAGADHRQLQRSRLPEEPARKGPGFSLEDAPRLGRTYEATAFHIQLSDMKSPTSVHAISTNTYTCKNCGGTHLRENALLTSQNATHAGRTIIRPRSVGPNRLPQQRTSSKTYTMPPRD